MSNDDQDALAKLDLFIARLQALRELVVNGLLDAELAYRASQDKSALACCWCGYDITEHDDEPRLGGDTINHPFRPAGTKSVAWLLKVPGPRGLFPHDHDQTPDIQGICVRCRIEAESPRSRLLE